MSKLADESVIGEMRHLAEIGDIDLNQERSKYFSKCGKSSSLTDEEMYEALAATTDDDDDLLVKNMILIEQRKTMSAA